MRLFCWTALLLLSFQRLSAQACPDSSACCADQCCCALNVAAPAGLMISHVNEGKEWMLAYRYMNNAASGLLSGTTAVSSAAVFNDYLMLPASAGMDMHMFMAMYGFSDHFTVMAMLNYNSMAMAMEMFSADQHHHSESNDQRMLISGPGDVKIHALYDVLRSKNRQIIISAGLSLPSGSITRKGIGDDVAYSGKNLPYAMQLGSGTVDALPGLSYFYTRDEIAFGAQSTATLHFYNNSVGYRFGNEMTCNAWLAYRWLSFLSSSLRAEYSLTGKIQGVDLSLYKYNEPSANPANYGGQRLSLYLGSAWQINKGAFKNMRFVFEYGRPLYLQVNGIQSKMTGTINTSLNYTF